MAEPTSSARVQQARSLLSSGASIAAIALLREWLAGGDEPELRLLLGQALRVNGQLAASASELRRLLAVAPDHREAALTLAFCLRDHGRIQAAAQVILAWFRRAPRADAETLAFARFLAELRAFAAARELLEQLAERSAQAELLLAGCALNLGDFSAAKAGYRRVLAIDPGQSAAWLRLAHCQRFRLPSDADLAAMHDARRRAPDGSMLAASLDFAIGKAYDDVGDYQAAVNRFRPANQTLAQLQPWSSAAFERQVRALLAVLPGIQPLLPAHHGSELLLVLGAPRAGTTLLADRLSRHRSVRNRGETNWLEMIATPWRERLPSAATATELAEAYRDQMRQDDEPSTFYLDKNPLNLMWADVARALLPGARVLCLRRDPRAVALSLWSNQFAHPAMAFSYDFAQIGIFLRGYQRLAAAMADALPANQFRSVTYADLVQGGDSIIAGLWHWLDLDPAEALPASSQQQGVTTASVFQVREPTHQRSLERWRNYANLVPELAEMSNGT